MYIYYMKWIKNNNLQSFLVSVTLKLVCFGHWRTFEKSETDSKWGGMVQPNMQYNKQTVAFIL